jgi:pumilio RNA-binding family
MTPYMPGMPYPANPNMAPFMNMYNPYMMWPGGGMPGGMPGFNGSMPQMAMYQMGMQPQAQMGSQGSGGPKNAPKSSNAQGNKSRSKERTRRRGKGKNARDRAPSLTQTSPSAAAAEDNNPNRSAALTEVRKQGTKCKLTIGEVLPHVIEFAQDQHGSRYLQTKLDEKETTEAEKEEVFNAVLLEAPKLASDVFANFVVQKLFDICSAEQKKQLVISLKDELLRLSKETYGCRVVQKAIQHVSRDSQLVLASELQKDVIGCIENMHGNHVIQKCIEQMPPDSVNFIIKAIEDQTEKMAAHMYGCRVIQRLLEHCASNQLQGMLEQILMAIQKLATDPYGNYVVQHMLEHGRIEDKKRIINVIQQNLVEFAKHKHSSNVVEKCFEVATVGEHTASLEAERSALMRTVLGEPGDPNPPLHQMMDDRYGNYIVQRMIEHSRGPEREHLQQQIMAAERDLQQSVNGKHILKALRDHLGQPLDK